jgi:hypothetical protein
MHRFRSHLAVLAAVLVAAAGCTSDPGITEPPPTTTAQSVFNGTLTLNGAQTFPFTVTGVGSINGQIISLMPNSELLIGLSLGTWNGSICQIVLANDAANQGDVVVGSTQTPGDFCIRVYDAAGNVTVPHDFVVEVTYQVAR